MNTFLLGQVLRNIAERSNACCNWGDKLYSRWERNNRIYCANSLEVLTDFVCLTSSLRVPRQSWETSS